MSDRGGQTLPRMAAVAMAGLFAMLLLSPAGSAAAQVPFVRDGEAGFVVSLIEFALAGEADEAAACPAGMSLNLQEIYALTPDGRRREAESDEDYMDRLKAAAGRLGTSADGRNLCEYPEAGNSDPNFRTVEGSSTAVFGLDLDGEASAEDFPGLEGGTGIDNQWYRVVGCSRSYQPSGLSNSFNIGMLTGSWGILFKLEGVDDIRNDDQVTVSLYANADPIRLSPTRVPLAYATYAAMPDPRFRASTTGKIENGVLTTQPVDARFRNEVNSMYLERPLRDARLQVTLAEDGSVSGYLSGYTPVEAMYDMQYGFRNGVTRDGELAPARLRAGSANGAAFVLGHTCHGAYHALYANADGHPDPETGRYTSVSTQYRIEAVPAFVVERAAEPDPGAQAGGQELAKHE